MPGRADRDEEQPPAAAWRDERFRALIEGTLDVVAIITSAGVVDYIAPSIQRLLGHAPEAVTGTSAFALVHPDDAPEVIARFTALLRGDCHGSIDLRLRHDDGSWRTFQLRARNMVDDPEVAGVVVNARDITDELAAIQTQRQLQAFFEATPDFVATFDPHGRALTVNRSFRELLGLPAGAPSALTLTDLFPREVTERLLEEGIPTATREGSWTGETHLDADDGRSIPISQVVLAHRSPGERVEFYSTLGRDITEEREARDALERSEAYFRSLIENSSDILAIVDGEGRIRFVSPSVTRVLGYRPEEVVGTSLFTLVDPDHLAAAMESFAAVMQSAERLPTPAEYRVRHKDGSWRRVESVSQNLLENPAVRGVVINVRDVTARRRAEDALHESEQQLVQAQKMEAVGRLAGGVAHDFNNLLTAIKGFTELLLLDLPEGDQRRAYAAEIQGAASRAAGLTRQLLAFSRRQVLKPEVTDLNETVRLLEKILGRLIGEDVRMRFELSPELGHVRADPGQVEQVVMNLVVNARDAMPGGGELLIRTSNARLTGSDLQRHRYVHPGDYVLLEVIDSGSGMTREIQERVFEPFFTTKEQGRGTGLGLSTVYGIVKQSGGYIWVDSEPGEGTRFRIYLPRVTAEPGPRAPRPAVSQTLEGTESVLLVEDELAVRVLVRRVLERAGYTVVAASNGREALELARRRDPEESPFDLLLTDVVMPEMSGPELANELGAVHPGLRILYMSGYNDEAIVHHGVLEAGTALIEKPFTPEGLLRRIREALSPSS